MDTRPSFMSLQLANIRARSGRVTERTMTLTITLLLVQSISC